MANVWQRFTREMRSLWSGPLTSRSPELAKFFGGSGGSSTGVPVTEWTALNYSAFWDAVSLIASDVASLPLILYKKTSIDGKKGKDRYTDSKLYRILHDEPNPEMTSIVFRETVQAHALTWGNGYAEIERDGKGAPVALWPLTPDRVTPYRDEAQRLRYRVANETGGADVFLPADIFHVPGLGFDGTMGYSVVAKARESIGLGIATERFGATFFGNGSTFGGILEHPGKMSPLAQENFKQALAARHQGVDRAHKFLVLEEGMKYQKLGIPPDEAQFLESRKFQIEEIARWFRLPPHKIGAMEHATFSNIEHQTLDYVRSCLRSWLVRWEQEINRKLISPLERNLQFAEHNLEGLLRGDSVARVEFYRGMYNIGAFSINMILEKENENGIGAPGDLHMVQGAMVPLNRINEIIDAQVTPKTVQAPAAPAPTPQREDPAILETMVKAHADAVARAEEYLTRAVTAETALAHAVGDTTELTTERDEAREGFHRAQSEADALKAQIVVTEQRVEREKAEAEEREADKATQAQRQADAQLTAAVAEANVKQDAIEQAMQARVAAAERAAADVQARVDALETDRLALLAVNETLIIEGTATAATWQADAAAKETALRQAEAEIVASRANAEAAEALLAEMQAERDRMHAESKARAATWAAQLATVQAEVDTHEAGAVASVAQIEAIRQEAEAAQAAVRQAQAEKDEALAASAAREQAQIAALNDVAEALRAATREKEEVAATAGADLMILRASAAATEAELVAAKTEQDAASALISEQQAKAAGLEAQLVNLRAETEAKTEAAAQSLADLLNLQARADSTEVDLWAAQAEKDALLAQLGVLQAEVVNASEALVTARAATKKQAAAAALALVTEVEQRAARTVQERADAFIMEQRNKEADRLASMLTAHRAIAVDAVSRIVRRESERARSKQATGQKLRAWAEVFYATHDATVVDALLPVVRAHLAWMQSSEDPELVVRTHARAYVDESKRHIMAVVDSDPDDLSVELERVLQHWEAKRADMFADRMMEEGIAYVRSYR